MISISTTSDSKKVLKKISYELLEKKITPCTHLTKISESSYIWDNKVVQKKEYQLEIKTTSKYQDLVISCIEKNHNYSTYELSKVNIDSLNEKYQTWFNKQLK